MEQITTLTYTNIKTNTAIDNYLRNHTKWDYILNKHYIRMLNKYRINIKKL